MAHTVTVPGRQMSLANQFLIFFIYGLLTGLSIPWGKVWIPLVIAVICIIAVPKKVIKPLPLTFAAVGVAVGFGLVKNLYAGIVAGVVIAIILAILYFNRKQDDNASTSA